MNLDRSAWKKVKLGDVAYEYSKRIDKPSESGFDRFVGSANIGQFDFRIKSWESTNDVESSMKQFQVDDYLLVRRSLYASDFRERAPLADFEGVCSGDILTIRENPEKTAKGFLIGVLNSPLLWKYVVANASGSITRRIKWKELANYEFLLPPKNQQAKLAALLWAANDVGENYSELGRSLSLIKNRTITNSITEFMSGNSILKLREVADIVGGYAFKSEEFNAISEGRRQVLKIANLTSNGLDLRKVPAFVEDKGYDSKFLFSNGDIVISLTGSNGRRDYGFAVINETKERYWVNQRLAIVRVNESKVLPKFLYYLMKENVFLDQFFMNATGTANQANVSTKDILNIDLPIPPIVVQTKLMHTLEAIDKNLHDTKLNVFNANAIQKQLINQIFSA